MIRTSNCAVRFFTVMMFAVMVSCINETKDTSAQNEIDTSASPQPAVEDRPSVVNTNQYIIDTGQANPDSILAYAKTLIGVPYLYACTDPSKGLDCSGFITHVFNHFGIAVPRSSVDFTNYGKTIPLAEAKPGDLILFTGTDSTIRVVGHMGIVESVGDTLRFIHSSSGKNNIGVIITPLGEYYLKRFVKVIRVFKEEYFD